ncbi:hypothetical protein [Litoreibacter meonggei]|uniref:hypothetical protein n=1 Tax=Litoreibacter meonggei TaxID=1049199 RepID=UPI001472CF77|nr:hypothetical protein [Litoreibacter meonggei]
MTSDRKGLDLLRMIYPFSETSLSCDTENRQTGLEIAIAPLSWAWNRRHPHLRQPEG